MPMRSWRNKENLQQLESREHKRPHKRTPREVGNIATADKFEKPTNKKRQPVQTKRFSDNNGAPKITKRMNENAKKVREEICVLGQTNIIKDMGPKEQRARSTFLKELAMYICSNPGCVLVREIDTTKASRKTASVPYHIGCTVLTTTHHAKPMNEDLKYWKMEPITPEFLSEVMKTAITHKCTCKAAVRSLLKGLSEGKIYFMLQGLWAGVTTQKMEELLNGFDYITFQGYNFKSYEYGDTKYKVPKNRQAEGATDAKFDKNEEKTSAKSKRRQAEGATDAKDDKDEETASANSSASDSDEDSDSDDEPLTALSKKEMQAIREFVGSSGKAKMRKVLEKFGTKFGKKLAEYKEDTIKDFVIVCNNDAIMNQE